MASKIIFDTPELLDETLVSLTEACNYFPGKKRSRSTAERYARKGNRKDRGSKKQKNNGSTSRRQ